METFDWIVIGNGLAGAALSYELRRHGLSVLLVDDGNPDSATRCSYGGIAYWSGTSPITQQLCELGIERHRQLSEELGATTEFRELDLLLTFGPEVDGSGLVKQYEKFAIAPQLISAAEARSLEPQLNLDHVGGAFAVKHGHVHPIKTLAAFNQAFRRLGGQQLMATVTGLVTIKHKVTGILTATQAYAANQVVVAAGGYSRRLLRQANVTVPLYHTHAEIVALSQVETKLRALIMPAIAQRFTAETAASSAANDHLWDDAIRQDVEARQESKAHEIALPILDSGVIQFLDGTTYLGQISRFRTDLTPAAIDGPQSEADIRRAITAQLPCLAQVPGQWRHCLVTFSRDGLPLIGPLSGMEGLHLFTGFTSPFAMLPPIAQRFVQWVRHGGDDELLAQMRVDRFENIGE